MAESSTSRTLKRLRDQGYLADVVEKWIPGANIRKDLFGFIDVMAIKDGETLAVQATSYPNVSARVKKISDHENIGSVRDANWKIEVWGWRKVKNRWQVRVVDVS
jgi:hypothetical protein